MSQQLKKLSLAKNEDKRLRASHLWIFSNEIDVKKTPLKNFAAGELVKIVDFRDVPIGIGYINPNTLLCARILTRDTNQVIDQNFFAKRIRAALSLREACFDAPFYRLIFGEGDFLPGVVVDRFGDILVVQITTAGMELLKNDLISALIKDLNPSGILLRNDAGSRAVENLSAYVEVVHGEVPDEITLTENNTQFIAPIQAGQKTGWFFDQRANRSKITEYISSVSKFKQRNKNTTNTDIFVLDTFSYIGAWGIQAADATNVSNVTFVEASKLACEYIAKNAELNNIAAEKIIVLQSDGFDALENLLQAKNKFDVIVLDPPAFVKRKKDLATGTAAYLRIHELALRLIPADGGVLFTTSCSQHLQRDMLLDVVRKAALKTQRKVQLLEELHQAKDHPIHPAIAETNYLKGFVIWVS